MISPHSHLSLLDHLRESEAYNNLHSGQQIKSRALVKHKATTTAQQVFSQEADQQMRCSNQDERSKEEKTVKRKRICDLNTTSSPSKKFKIDGDPSGQRKPKSSSSQSPFPSNVAASLLPRKSHKQLRSKLQSFNQEMTKAAEEGDEEKAEAIMAKIKAEGLTPNASTYSSFINVYVNTRNSHPTWQILEEMDEANISPDFMTSLSLMDLYINQKDGEGALKILNKMEQGRIKPNVVQYNKLIELYIKQKDGASVLTLLNKMKQAKIKPNESTYSMLVTMMELYVEQKDKGNALKLLNKANQLMQEQQVCYTMYLLLQALRHTYQQL